MNDPVRLAAFDLDGTLLRGDTVFEAIARPLGHLERTQEFENLNRVEDIKTAREEVASWYRPHSLSVLSAYVQSMQLAPGVRDGFGMLRRQGIKIAIVSITWEFAVEWWAKELGADFYVGTGLSQGGDISHFWPHDKPVWLAELVKRLGLSPSEVAAVGDSPSDMPMLEIVGHPFFVGHTKPEEVPAGFRHFPDGDICEIAETIISNPTTREV